MAFVEGTIEIVLQLAAALSVLAGILGSAYIIATKTSWFSGKVEARKQKRRQETCPQKEICQAEREANLHRVEKLGTQVTEQDNSTLALHGSHIVLFCLFVQFRGYLSRYERTWLQNSYDEYSKNGGNHGVTDIFKETMLLPEFPPAHGRRLTDRKE